MTSVDLSIIIVNYNVKEFLAQALNSIVKAAQSLRTEIFVVDNASTDGSVRLVRERFPTVTLIANEQNVGFSAANNQALRLAQGRFICLINPDTVVQENTFTILLDFLQQHPEAGMVGCKILNPDGSLQLGCKRSYPTPWVAFSKIMGLSTLFPKSRLFGQYNLTYLDDDQIHEVQAISGAFMLLRQEILTRVGTLDEDFFMYGEDLDWCFRVREGGWKIFYVPLTRIIHYKGESSKQRQSDYLREFYRAMDLFVRKHYKGWSFIFPDWLLLSAIWLRAGVSFMIKLIKRMVLPLWDAFLIAVALLFALIFRFGNLDHIRSYGIVYLLYSLVWIVCLTLAGSYHRHKFSAASSMLAVGIGLIFNGFLTFLLPQIAFSRIVVGVAGALNLVFLPGWRILLKVLYRLNLLKFRSGFGAALFGRRTLVVGDMQMAGRILQKLRYRLDSTYDVRGIVSPLADERDQVVEGVPVIGSLNSLPEAISFIRAQEVIFATDKLTFDQILSVMARARHPGVDFHLVPGNLEYIIGKASIHRMDDVPLWEIEYRLYRTEYRLLKRMTDIVLAAAGILVFLPLFFYNLWIKKWRIRRQVIYQEHNRRPGYYLFTGNGAEKSWQKWLPALLAILIGRISFVGSELEAGNKRQIHDGIELKPGLTGLAQLSAKAGMTQQELEKSSLFYIKNYSPLLDFEILIRALLKKKLIE